MKKRVVLSMLAGMLLLQSIPVSAQDYGEVSSQTQAASVPSQFTSAVKPTDLSKIIVTLPARMDLSLNEAETQYINQSQVSAKGDLHEDYRLEVSTPSTVTYKSTGNPDVTGAVTFGTQTWTSAQLEASKTVLDSRDISVAVNNSNLKYVTYDGVLDFDIEVVQNHVHTPGEPDVYEDTEPTCGEPGVYSALICCTECGCIINDIYQVTPATGNHQDTYSSFIRESPPYWDNDHNTVWEGTKEYEVYCYDCGMVVGTYDEPWIPYDMSNFNVNKLNDGNEHCYAEGFTEASKNDLCNGNVTTYKLPPLLRMDGTLSGIYEVTGLDYQAFKDCYGVVRITLPPTLTYIDDYAFKNCTNLETVDIPSSVWNIGSNIFSGCGSLTTINYDGTKSQFQSISGYDNLSGYTIHCTDGDLTIS